MNSFAQQQARDGLNGVTLLGISYYAFVLVSRFATGHVIVPVAVNRLLSLVLIVCVRRRFLGGLIAPQNYYWWSFLLGVWGLFGVAFNYAYGDITHVGARTAMLMIFGSLVGAPRSLLLLYQLLSLTVCAYMQIHYPSPTDPYLNLAIPLYASAVGHSIANARFQIGQQLFNMNSEVRQRGQLLEETLQRAQHRQRNLDADVMSATRDLEQTNQQLQQAIDLQVAAFEENQKLHGQVADALCFQSIGKAAGAAAHDFNNLLAVISCTLEILEPELSWRPEDEQVLTLLSDEIDRSTKVGREILALSGKQILHKDAFALGPWLEHLRLTQSQRLGPSYSIQLLLPLPELMLRGDREQLSHSIVKLLQNAAESMPAGGPLCIRQELGNTGCVLIEDSGVGLVGPASAHLFDAFFTTKEAKTHCGLGLAAARAILRQQGGEVEYAGPNRPYGSTFRIRLPLDEGGPLSSGRAWGWGIQT